jgi:hypothetical protein
MTGNTAEKLQPECSIDSKPRGHGMAGSKVRKVGWYQTVSIVKVKHLSSKTIFTIFPLIMTIFFSGHSFDCILQTL